MSEQESGGKGAREWWIKDTERLGLDVSTKNDFKPLNPETVEIIKELLAVIEAQRVALEFYTHYDKESVRHMDTEWLKPERVAVIKPLDRLGNGKGYAPEDMHPIQIHQDATFSYGPKYRIGLRAREALTLTDAKLRELGEWVRLNFKHG